MKKVYLGDSVYADFTDWGDLVLTTENGYPDDPRNRIVLEPEVYHALIEFVKSARVEVEVKEDTEPAPANPEPMS